MKVSALLSGGTGGGAKLPTSHTLHYWPLPLFSCLPSPVATATATATATAAAAAAATNTTTITTTTTANRLI